MSHSRLREIAALPDPIERARVLGAVMAEQQALVEEAARMRRQAIAEARENGHRLEEIAGTLGVSPGRISQMRKGATAPAPEPHTERTPSPTAPAPGPRTERIPPPTEPAATPHAERAASPSAPDAERIPPSAEPHSPYDERMPSPVVRRALPTEPSAYAAGCTFAGATEREGVRAGLRLLDVGREPAREHVATCLRVRPGEDVIARRRLVLADDVPVRVAVSYFRADLFAGTPITAPELLGPGLHEAITAHGHAFGHAEETLLARPATGPEADLLRLDPGEWVVQVLRASYSTEDTPVHVLETVCAAARHVFSVSQAGGCDLF
ncbi:UTRA domain-containing protein [Actinoallomurus spadix]|uniref:UbiC transcription regulator-associated domain-containing protein n=1 Tax=Actinoallomurus spadix TaxID=79912 RepID=A0ABN0XTP4_9ACTN|nr:UTRA domain-containing protein [Actinoallomurus spadix]MCO5991128.1 UTRA domain-containing protein [Actinoallomurus spadix]